MVARPPRRTRPGETRDRRHMMYAARPAAATGGTMAALPGVVDFGWPLGFPANTAMALTGAFALNSATSQVEFVFPVPAGFSGAVTRLGYLQGSAFGTPPAYTISLQGVDGSGNPDGTVKGGGSPASKTFTPAAADDGTFKWVPLDNPYTPAAGDYLALVIAYASGTIDGSNDLTVRPGVGTGAGAGWAGPPYSIQNASGTRTRQTARPVFGWGTAAAAFGCPISAVATQAFNVNTPSVAYGMRFALPAGGPAFQVGGVRFKGTLPAAQNVTLTLTAADGTTALQQTTVDGDAVAANTAGNVFDLRFGGAPAALQSGVAYYLELTPGGATSTLLQYCSVTAAADLAALPGGADWQMTDVTAGGVRTAAPTKRPVMALLLAGLGT